MNQVIIKRAGEVIASKAGYVGGGMEGYAVLSLIDESGYPSASTLTIAKADGINWLTFCTSPDSNKAKRIIKNNRASVCLSTSEYNITLVGTIEIVTDSATKKEMWLEPMNDGSHWSGPDDPTFCVLRFNTERYNIFFADDGSEAVGNLANPSNLEKGAILKLTPGLGFKGQCVQATELYEKAFGARVIEKIRYADAKDLQYKEVEKDFVFYSEMVVGNQIISLGDSSEPDGELGISLLIEFDTMDELNAAYKIMSDGAKIVTPMGSSSYCDAYVSLVDKFGIHWDFMSGYTG